MRQMATTKVEKTRMRNGHVIAASIIVTTDTNQCIVPIWRKTTAMARMLCKRCASCRWGGLSGRGSNDAAFHTIDAVTRFTTR